MAEEDNKKTDEFSNFDDLDLESELNKADSTDNEAEKDDKPEKTKEDSELEGFFEDLDQLEKEPEANNKEPVNAKESNTQKTGLAAPVLAKKKLKLPNIKIPFKKLLKYGVGLALIVATVIGGYYLFFWIKDFYIDKKDDFVNILPGGAAVEIPDFVNQIVLEDTPTPIINDSSNQNTSANKLRQQALAPDKNGKWLVQVGACLKQNCINNVIASLDKNSLPRALHQTQNKQVTSTFIKLTSLDVYDSVASVQRDLNLINKRNSFGLNAYSEQAPNGIRIVFGLFPLETYGIDDYIGKVQTQLLSILPQTVFETFYEKNENSLTKIYLGPFNSKQKAQTLLDDLRTKEGFNQAFLTQK